jgi:hypothetical protein
MIATAIEVRVKGRGVVRGDDATSVADTDTTCSTCGQSADTVASIGDGFACAGCLRQRLDAISVGRYRLRDSSKPGLPWGKLTS